MILKSMKILITPLNYMKISHENKFALDIVIPFFISILVCFFFYYLSYENMIGDNSIIYRINSILGILIGFFIASLAAVSTFDRPEMDNIMEGIPPTLHKLPLTRRQFLCYLFGYLSFVTINIILISDTMNVFSVDIINLISTNTFIYILIFTPYFFLITNIFITLFLGLSFLTENIHKKKKSIINKVDK